MVKGSRGAMKCPLVDEVLRESDVSPRVIKRRYVLLVQEGSMPRCTKTEKDATGER